MAVLFANNATSPLQAAITTSATTITIASGDASLFPAPTSPDYFMIAAVNDAGDIEIMKCTGRAGAALTVVRAQEGTTAIAFAAGTPIDLRLTKGTMEAFPQTASALPVTPTGGIGSTNAQAALAELDAKKVSVRTSPTALANNATISSGSSGAFFGMDLAGGVQIATLPSTTGLADGFSVVVRGTGLPSGYQTSYIAGGGKNVSYRGSTYANFHLIGNDEVFRFTWLSGLNFWLAECLAQPGAVSMYRGQGGVAWNSWYTAFTPITFNANYGNSAPFDTSLATRTLVPVAGVYQQQHLVYMSASAGGGVSAWGYLYGSSYESLTHNSVHGMTFKSFTLNEDASSLEISHCGFMKPGNICAALMSVSNTGLYYYPANNFQTIQLLSR
jgi:hypothetical protein